MSVRVILVDDHEILRSGLRAQLQSQPDLEVVASVDNGRTAVREAVRLEPDLVIMDIGMRDLNGIDATTQLRQLAPAVRVIALSMHADRQFVSGMLKAGAMAYVVKSAPFDELLEAIRAVLEDRMFTSPQVTGVVLDDYARPQTATSAAAVGPAISAREREVLQLIAEGCATKEIASRLSISTNTVDSHRRRIMEKLRLHSVADLTKYAIREGLTSLED